MNNVEHLSEFVSAMCLNPSCVAWGALEISSSLVLTGDPMARDTGQAWMQDELGDKAHKSSKGEWSESRAGIRSTAAW